MFQRWGAQAWVPAWLLTTGVSLGLSYLAPQWILPLFHKFEPLPDGDLKGAIHAMAERCRFPLKEVFQIDGSRRSTKTNAFFTGFGKNKRIALYDTLIQRHTVSELVAILAHEIGHYRKHHIVQRIVISVVEMGVLFFLLGLVLENQQLFAAFGVESVSIYGSLVFFSLLFSPTRRLLNIALMMLSRRHEFEADAYAAEVTGNADDLCQGLKKLAQENLSNLTPHPFFVWLNYSHPPMPAASCRAGRSRPPSWVGEWNFIAGGSVIPTRSGRAACLESPLACLEGGHVCCHIDQPIARAFPPELWPSCAVSLQGETGSPWRSILASVSSS